jgi:hypothetical protein
VATLLAGLLAGIVPAWKSSRIDVNTALKDESRAAAGLGVGKVARWLVSAQIAFSTMLLVSAGVLSLTVYMTRHANLRYDPDKLLTGRIELQEGTQPTSADRARFYRTLLERLRNEPGIEAVAVTSRNFIGRPARGVAGSRLQRLLPTRIRLARRGTDLRRARAGADGSAFRRDQ